VRLAILTTVVLALVVATAASAKPPPIHLSAPPFLRGFHPVLHTARKDRQHGCQAPPSRRLHVPGPRSAREKARRASTVACEQPPRTQLITLAELARARAHAVAVLLGFP